MGNSLTVIKWASVVGNIDRAVPDVNDSARDRMNTGLLQDSMSILHLHYELNSANPTGEVRTAYMRVVAPVVPLSLRYNNDPGERDDQDDDDKGGHDGEYTLELSGTFYPDVDLVMRHGDTKTVFAMQVFWWPREPGMPETPEDEDEPGATFFLVLQCVDEEYQVYERMGCDAVLDTHDPSEEESVESALLAQRGPNPSAGCHDLRALFDDPENRRVITII